AMMVAADLFEAVVEKADMRGTDLRGANLYGADFALIHSDRDTKVDDAIQDRVRVLPLRGGA
ncbi:MAG: pentapeptide repeat-containing protein, partial [Sandaracinaceae bacterium]|nr:pentapeptide repeat-containing protein [Sandaracinaceae bacterium]